MPEKKTGTREEVWQGIALKTKSGLTKSDFILSKGKIVSKKKSELAKQILKPYQMKSNKTTEEPVKRRGRKKKTEIEGGINPLLGVVAAEIGKRAAPKIINEIGNIPEYARNPKLMFQRGRKTIKKIFGFGPGENGENTDENGENIGGLPTTPGRFRYGGLPTTPGRVGRGKKKQIKDIQRMPPLRRSNLKESNFPISNPLDALRIR